MPRTGPKTSSRLGIELRDPQPTYFPGDTLQGYVTCEESTDLQSSYSSALVRVKLFGRAKTKYVVKNTSTSTTSIERGRAVFFEEHKILHKGVSSCDGGGQHAWPFEFTIPTTSKPGFATRNDCDQFRADPPYLHTRDAEHQEIDVTQHPLPSVMYYKSESAMGGQTVEAFIEYVLFAEGAGTTASYPLYVRAKAALLPIQNYKIQTRTFEQRIKTLKLLPEYAETALTFKQKSRMFFRPSKTPRYSYTIKVEYPTVIQLEHPEPIPLKIYLIPNLDAKKTTVASHDVLSSLPAVKLVNMELELMGGVNIRCPGGLWDSGTEKTHTFEFHFRKPPDAVELPAVPPPSNLRYPMKSALEVSSDSSSMLAVAQSMPAPMDIWQNNEGTEVIHTPAGWQALHATTPTGSSFAFDVGAHAVILLGCSASSTLSHPPVSFKRQVYPTFSTYNIHIKYRLRWRFYLVCAGVERQVSGEAPVTVMAPSEEQEENKKRQLGNEGMKRNHDDMEAGLGSAVQFIGQVLQVVA